MNTPRGLIGLALLFWGWETGLLLWAALMAAALEGSYFIKVRWELADSDLNRICDLCGVLFLSAGMLLFSTEDRLIFIFKFAQWLPLCFFPLALAQAYGDRPSIPINSFNWLLRRIPQSPLSRTSFNISYGYFAFCLMAASASTRPNSFFYLGVSVLILVALGQVRPNRISWPVWMTLAVMVVLGGRFSHQGLRYVQNTMETALGGWIADLLRTTTDPRECRTSIGHSGEIPLSSKIVLRLRVPPGDVPPTLLREGAYDAYRRGTWTAGSNEFAQAVVNLHGTALLLTPKKFFSRVEIAGYFTSDSALLPLPHGTFEIDDFPGLLSTNRLGVASVSVAQTLLDFRANYWTGASMDAPPGPMDLAVPEEEKPALIEVADRLGLSRMDDDRKKIRAVARFFQEKFHYSLNGPNHIARNDRKSPLGQFLTNTMSGHCEYFATATVLLLRQAGVNARYITGYAVPESARHNDTFLVRERHRHAWALVYHSDTSMWEQIDNTPSSWAQVAEASTPWWEGTTDFLSNLYFGFSKWRWGKTSFSRYAQSALAPLVLYLVWRILSTRRRQQTATGVLAGRSAPVWPGLDSELYLIDRKLAGVQLSRQPNEPLLHWQQRLEEAFPASPSLREIFAMHRRLRFDPRGLESRDREALRRRAGQWLAEFSAYQEQQQSAGPS
ncbi:MAG TPA: transglutaminase-like domain-containing protein [Candidatus Cybelea sp.]|jgi:transglutaminase-like putative cysteine protease|nr:transglutaminase-like domain-containing protein [Candidatus Cybelea sp.]